MLKELDFDFYKHTDDICYYDNDDNNIDEKLIYQKLKNIIMSPLILEEDFKLQYQQDISPYSLVKNFKLYQDFIKKGDFHE